MPLPFLAWGAIAAMGALGVGKTVKAGIDAKDAKDTNAAANYIVDRAKRKIEDAKLKSKTSLDNLGKRKLDILDTSINNFITTYEKIKNIKLSDSEGLYELNKFKLDKQQFAELKESGEYASSVLAGAASGALFGGLAAFGAYGAVGLFASASTGTAIAALSGAAATNATLAFLGGGSLAAGGLGIAGGTAVLGGLVAAPALAVMGLIVGAKASAEKDKAYANYATAQKFEEEMKVASDACYAIEKRSNMFHELLDDLDELFVPLIGAMKRAILLHNGDYSYFDEDQKHAVAAARSIAGAVKAILDTPILNKDGSLTSESEEVATEIREMISA